MSSNRQKDRKINKLKIKTKREKNNHDLIEKDKDIFFYK